MTALMLDLDGVLGDTRPLWEDWLSDASRVLEVDARALPHDRGEAAVALDDGAGNWRVLLGRYAAERATWMALEAIQCLGGAGYINETATGRLLRDAKLYEIGAGTSEIRRMLIGREIFEKTR